MLESFKKIPLAVLATGGPQWSHGLNVLKVKEEGLCLILYFTYLLDPALLPRFN